MPVAPPNDTFTSPPAARTAAIWSANCFCRGSKALNQLALQPALVTKARLKDLRFPLLPSWARVVVPFESRPMSTYGATSTFPPPVAGGVVGGVVGGLVVGVVVGFVVGGVVGVVVGLVVVGVAVGVAPPEQDAPLIVQLVGAPLPATTKPNEAVPPAGIEVSQLGFLAVETPPEVVIVASQKLPSFAVEGSPKASCQPFTAAPVPLVIVYFAW